LIAETLKSVHILRPPPTQPEKLAEQSVKVANVTSVIISSAAECIMTAADSPPVDLKRTKTMFDSKIAPLGERVRADSQKSLNVECSTTTGRALVMVKLPSEPVNSQPEMLEDDVSLARRQTANKCGVSSIEVGMRAQTRTNTVEMTGLRERSQTVAIQSQNAGRRRINRHPEIINDSKIYPSVKV
jgi:hypothetical protein